MSRRPHGAWRVCCGASRIVMTLRRKTHRASCIQSYRGRYFRQMIKGMSAAPEHAHLAASLDEVPIGAVVMRGDEIIAAAHNETVPRRNPTYHAEYLDSERALGVLETDRLTGCTLYVTLE